MGTWYALCLQLHHQHCTGLLIALSITILVSQCAASKGGWQSIQFALPCDTRACGTVLIELANPAEMKNEFRMLAKFRRFPASPASALHPFMPKFMSNHIILKRRRRPRFNNALGVLKIVPPEPENSGLIEQTPIKLGFCWE